MLTPTLGIVTLIGIEKIVTFLVMLSILIVLHELGHFFVARRSGVRVNEFALGMGPKLAGWVSPRSGTLYSLRALPIGGFCLMEGEDNKTSEAEQQREFRARETGRNAARSSANFQAKGPWVRLAIVVSGPAVNFLLSYVILTAGALAFGVQSENVQPIVGEVVAGTPAAI
ncbi:MAG: site-2 protease family protein, partial [Candidatus Eremiobacteraeota bacterium]|nr:site-2 protease family protein [Candidatus Eremiobacteraeota bacterium]